MPRLNLIIPDILMAAIEDESALHELPIAETARRMLMDSAGYKRYVASASKKTNIVKNENAKPIVRISAASSLRRRNELRGLVDGCQTLERVRVIEARIAAEREAMLPADYQLVLDHLMRRIAYLSSRPVR